VGRDEIIYMGKKARDFISNSLEVMGNRQVASDGLEKQNN